MRVVAIDIDSVLADIIPHIIPILNQKNGTNLRASDIKEWDHPVNGYSIGHYIRSCLADPSFVLSMPEVEGARGAMAEIYKKNEIVIATGRPGFCKNNTLKWLDGRFLYDKIVFSKEKTVEKLGADILIDDCFHYMERFTNSGGRGVLLDRPWNQGILDENKCVRAKNWEFALKMLNSME